MPKYEFAIAVCDEAETHRKKEGDIIAVKPSPWQWGKKELDQYLIITIDGLTKEEADKLCIPQFETGEDWWPSDELPQPKIIAKRRFKISLDTLKSGFHPMIELGKIRDKNIKYQPFKDKNVIISKIAQDSAGLIYDKHLKKPKRFSK